MLFAVRYVAEPHNVPDGSEFELAAALKHLPDVVQKSDAVALPFTVVLPEESKVSGVTGTEFM